MPALSQELIDSITKSVSDGFDEQIAFTQKLIHIGGQRGEEQEIQDFMFKQFADRGYAPVKFDIDEAEIKKHIGAGNFSATHSKAPIVVGVHEPKAQADGGRSLIINGHVDVVPLGPSDLWANDPYSGHIEGDQLFGRGSGDMRGGVGVYVKALDALRDIRLQPGSKVILESVVEEESTGNGTLMTHVKGYKADASLIPEPMGEELVRANVGVLWFQIEVRGKPVHVREMATGTNAIDASWKVVGALRELEKDWNARKVGRELHVDSGHPELVHPLSKTTPGMACARQKVTF